MRKENSTPSIAPSFSSDFSQQLDNGAFYDVEFVFEDGSASFMAHKFILATR